jgi:uncharacterized membrane protein YfcA
MIWRYFFLALAGIAGGVIAGMGMGGGTLLIPILTLLLDVPQHIAQWVNLIAFVPTAIGALIIHFKNKLVEKKMILPFLIPALLTSIPASFLAIGSSAETLKRIFGVFLIVMAIFSLIMVWIEHKREVTQKIK